MVYKEIEKLNLETKATTPQQTETNITDMQNNFDKVNINDVYKYFKAGLVEKKYLTEQKLNSIWK